MKCYRSIYHSTEHMWVYKVTNNISNLIYCSTWTVRVMDRH